MQMTAVHNWKIFLQATISKEARLFWGFIIKFILITIQYDNDPV